MIPTMGQPSFNKTHLTLILNLMCTILWQKPLEWNVDERRAMNGSFVNTPVFGPEDKLLSLWR